MSWAELGWPNLSPEFPEPHSASLPPPRPPVPADIAAQVRAAEQRRGIFVPICALIGAAIFGAGLAFYRASGAGDVSSDRSGSTLAALALMGVGLLIAFVVPALVVLLVIGPRWEQRTQHLQLIRWEQERRLWCEREREHYLATLSPPQQEALRRALATARNGAR